jgi:hypothetical protein
VTLRQVAASGGFGRCLVLAQKAMIGSQIVNTLLCDLLHRGIG